MAYYANRGSSGRSYGGTRSKKSRRAFTRYKKRGTYRGRGGTKKKSGVYRAMLKAFKETRAAAKQRHVVQGYSTLPVHGGLESAKEVQQSCFALPVTTALPPMRPFTPYVSEAYRETRKVRMTGCKVELQVSIGSSLMLSGAMYHSTDVNRTVFPDANTYDPLPKDFVMGFKEGSEPARMITLAETGFLAGRNGPYRVRDRRDVDKEGKAVAVWELDSPDGTMHNCPVEDGKAGPVGKVEVNVGSRGEPDCKKYGPARSVNVVLPGEPSKWVKKAVSLYWKLDQTIEFQVEEGRVPMLESYLQVMLSFKCMEEVPPNSEEASATVVGILKHARVKLYWESLH